MSYKGVFVLFSVTPHNSNNLSDDILIIYTDSCYNFVWSLKNSHQKKIWNLKISNTWHGNVLFFDKRSRLIEIFHKHLILQIRFFTKNQTYKFRNTPPNDSKYTHQDFIFSYSNFIYCDQMCHLLTW